MKKYTCVFLAIALVVALAMPVIAAGSTAYGEETLSTDNTASGGEDLLEESSFPWLIVSILAIAAVGSVFKKK